MSRLVRMDVAFLGCALVCLAASCGPQQSSTTETPAAGSSSESPAAATAAATLAPTQGNSVTGLITFTEEAGGVRIHGDIAGLTPGDHGIHLHDVGDCSAPDASSAGAHWNPDSAAHGGPDAAARHAGDLGNVTADASGNAHIDRVQPGLSLQGDKGVVGRSVVVHATADDLTSQPAGNSGARVACGVIQMQ
jgi:Cu-Zn family superoxide dismutase